MQDYKICLDCSICIKNTLHISESAKCARTTCKILRSAPMRHTHASSLTTRGPRRGPIPTQFVSHKEAGEARLSPVLAPRVFAASYRAQPRLYSCRKTFFCTLYCHTRPDTPCTRFPLCFSSLHKLKTSQPQQVY